MADVGNLRILITAVDKTAAGMKTAIKGVGGFAKQHKVAMLAIGGAAVAGLGFATKAAMDYQAQMAEVSTMLDAETMPMMDEFKSTVLDMSKKFGEGTETLSKGLYDILSASIPAEQALGVLEVSAKAATAGITDTGTAADAVTTIINSFGLSAGDAESVSDLLFATVKRGKTTFAELAPAIGNVASIASQSGLSMEDMSASLATMTRSGIGTEEAVTSLRGVVQAFLKPTDDAREAAAAFGLELNTNTLRTEGLTGVMDKLSGASTEQLAAIFPNIRALKGMAAMVGDTAGFQEDLEFATNRAGKTQEAYQKIIDTSAFRMKQLKESVKVLGTSFGEIMIPMLEKVVAGLSKLVEWFTNLSPGMKTVIVVVIAVVGGLALLMAIIGFLAPVIAALGAGFMLLISPIGLIVVAIVALIAIFFIFKDEIMAIVAGVWEVIKAGFEAISTILSAAWEVAKAIFTVWVAGYVWFYKMIIGIFKILIGVLEWWSNQWKMGWIGLQIMIADAWNGIIKMTEDAANRLISIVNSVISGLNKIPGVSFPKIPPLDLSAFKISTDAMKEEVATLGEKSFQDYIQPGLDYMKGATAEYGAKLKGVAAATKAFTETSKAAGEEFKATVGGIEWKAAEGGGASSTNVQSTINIENLNVADEEEKKKFFEEFQQVLSGGVENTITL